MSPRPTRSRSMLPRAALAVLVLLLGIWLGGHPSWLPTPLRNALVDDSEGRLVHEALDVITHDYYRPISRSKLVDKGLAAAVASLGDPYSHYFDPLDYRAFLHQSNPHLSGVGIDVVPDPRGLRIADVFAGSPAARARLQRGDLITRVGTTSLANRTVDFASRLIKGRAGTRVTLTILSRKRTRTVTITRADVVIPVASARMVVYHGVKVGDVRLTAFDDGAGSEVRSQVQRLLHMGARALILDLRSNGGGLLDEAVNVASVFIADGTIVSTAGRSQPRQVYVAKGSAIAPRIPMVALVDRGTASASEIVAGALKDRGRGRLVGTNTYGKGVFQEIRTLSNGGALDITVGEYFTPSGHNLGGGGVRQGLGIAPNIYVRSSASGADRQLAAAERAVVTGLR